MMIAHSTRARRDAEGPGGAERSAPPFSAVRRVCRLLGPGSLLVLASCAPAIGGRVLPSGRPAPVFDLPPLEENAESLHETERDWAIALGTVRWAWEQGLDDRPIGEVVAVLATTFIGTPYAPGTLELPGPERLVVNLRTFDCVTLVEHVLVLARLTVLGDSMLASNRSLFRDRYRGELTRLRYRGGVLSEYPSRLHYFSEWIRDAEEKGWVRSMTESLGGEQDYRPIRFMSENPEAYRQLGENPRFLDAIREMETRVTATPRFYIPEDRIAEREAGIQDGDIIAAVSSLDGLDVAHTGIALWRENRLHLLHAPLVGDSVQVSELPLAERIQGFTSQVGIMVARPQQP